MGGGVTARVLVAAGAVVALAGCTSSTPGASPSRGPSPSPSASSPHLYRCGHIVFDPVSVEEEGLERDDPELRELVESLGRSTSDTVTGWRVISREGTQVDAIARVRRGRYLTATFQRAGDSWVPDEFGNEGCRAAVVVGDRSPVGWRLDAEPRPSDTELAVFAYDILCSGQRKLTPGNTRFDVDYTEDEVIVIATAVTSPGGDCTGDYWRLKVPLAEPVGDRAVFDATTWPPRQRHP